MAERLVMGNTFLMVLDIQGNLASLMHERERLFANAGILIRGAGVLDVPIIWTEQYPEGLGPTVPEIAGLLEDVEPLPKRCFSCCGDQGIMQRIEAMGRRQVLIAGIESHICVCQTTLDLLARGYEVHVVTDADSSRVPENVEIATGRMERAGAVLTSTEMALFELLGAGEGDRFKAILKLVR